MAKVKPDTHPDVREIDAARMLYTKAHAFLRELRFAEITPQQRSTLRGQALSGDVAGARKGLAKLIGRDNDTD